MRDLIRNLTAATYFLLALFGCNEGGTTILNRATANGTDTIHSETRIKAGVAHFECVSSASGRCHYTLFPRCPAPRPARADAECSDAPIERFSVRQGASREVVGLPEFALCVASDDAPLQAGCAGGTPRRR